MTLSNAIMYQAMTKYAAMLATPSLKTQGPFKRISSEKKWYQQTPRRFLSLEPIDIL